MRDLRTLVLIAMLGAASFVLMATLQVPILPAAPYLRYDPSDVLGLMTAFILGPAAGVAVVGLKAVLYFLFRARSIFGPLANFIAVAAFVAGAGWVFRRRPGPSVLWMLAACGAGALARLAAAIPANFIILRLQFGMPPAQVAKMLIPVIIPFNALASALNGVLAAVLLAALWRRGVGAPAPLARELSQRR
jgi:riboflavin transporter FmnP